MTAYEQATATTAMRTERPVIDTTVHDQAPPVADAAKNEVGAVAGSAKGAAADVAGTAKEQVAQVATEAKSQLGTLTTQAKTQVTEQANVQTQKAAQAARGFADQLQALARGDAPEGVATDLVREISQRVQQIAGKLETSEPQDLLDEVRRYARNRPGMFLLSAVAAGFVGGRLAKGATAEDEPADKASSWTPSAPSNSVDSGSAYTPSYGAAGTYPEEPVQSNTYGGSI